MKLKMKLNVDNQSITYLMNGHVIPRKDYQIALVHRQLELQVKSVRVQSKVMKLAKEQAVTRDAKLKALLDKDVYIKKVDNSGWVTGDAEFNASVTRPTKETISGEIIYGDQDGVIRGGKINKGEHPISQIRGYGNSTGKALVAIGTAMQNPGILTYYTECKTIREAKYEAQALTSMIDTIGLTKLVVNINTMTMQVFVMSHWYGFITDPISNIRRPAIANDWAVNNTIHSSTTTAKMEDDPSAVVGYTKVEKGSKKVQPYAESEKRSSIKSKKFNKDDMRVVSLSRAEAEMEVVKNNRPEPVSDDPDTDLH